MHHEGVYQDDIATFPCPLLEKLAFAGVFALVVEPLQLVPLVFLAASCHVWSNALWKIMEMLGDYLDSVWANVRCAAILQYVRDAGNES